MEILWRSAGCAAGVSKPWLLPPAVGPAAPHVKLPRLCYKHDGVTVCLGKGGRVLSQHPACAQRCAVLCALQVPAFLEVVDIAGLVKGAAQGEGLGNAFLSHIQVCDSWAGEGEWLVSVVCACVCQIVPSEGRI